MLGKVTLSQNMQDQALLGSTLPHSMFKLKKDLPLLNAMNHINSCPWHRETVLAQRITQLVATSNPIQPLFIGEMTQELYNNQAVK